MNDTATLAAPVKTAKEARIENLAINNGLPLVAITGNTYPIKNVLWAFGGNFDSANKCWMVPSHKADEAKALAEKFAPKPKAPKAPAATVAAPAVKATPKAKPAKAKAEKKVEVEAVHNSRTNLRIRVISLAEVMQKVYDDLSSAPTADGISMAQRLTKNAITLIQEGAKALG